MRIRYTKAGCDISAGWFDVCLKRAKAVHTARFTNDAEGFRLFYVWLRERKIHKVHVCMEHTGGYEYALATSLIQNGHYVSLIDGCKSSSYAKSFRGKGKSDRKDAEILLAYLAEHNPELWAPRPDEYKILAELTRLREALEVSVRQWKNRARSPAYSLVCIMICKTIAMVLDLQLKSIEKEIQKHIDRHPHLTEQQDLLVTIPGVAALSAAKILGEMGPVENYRSARDLAKAAGVAPIECSSGTKKVRMLPVYGNGRLRKALYFPAMVARSRNELAKRWTEKVASNGPKAKMTVQVAMMRKMCHAVYGVLRHGQPYNENLLYAQLLKDDPPKTKSA